MRFKVYGPYDIGVDKGYSNWIDRKDTDSFWEKIRRKGREEFDLPDACGVYLFGMRGVEGRTKGTAARTLPWYVGKAEKLTFKKECFNFKNLYYYNSILINKYGGEGRPFLYLLARVDRVDHKNDKFSPPASNQEEFLGVRFVEEMFIQQSLSANNDLLNKAMTKMIKETSIRGFLNTRNYPSPSVDKLKGLFGIKHEPAKVTGHEEVKFLYEVHGPHDVLMKNPNKVKERAIKVEETWSSILGKEQKQLNTTCGVYVVGMRIGNNTTPWYVGTTYDRSFEKICFNSDIEKLQKVINSKKGQPVVYFLPRLTEKKRDFQSAKPTKNKPADLDYVKRVLLEYGVQTNKEILFEDSLDTEILRDLYVEGFVDAKKGEDKKKVVQGLRQLLGFKK